MENITLTGKKTALYMRVSTDEQARRGLSLDEQKHALQHYAEAHNMVVVGEFIDAGISARKGYKKRPALLELLQRIEAGNIEVILFIKLDRWFRNVKDYYKVQEQLDAKGVQWIATQEDYNTTTSAGRLNLNIRLSIAQNESDMIADRIRFINEGKKRRREALTGSIPYGYKIENKHIVPNEEQAAIMRDLFQYFADCQQLYVTYYYSIEKYNNPLGNPANMRRQLKNPSFIGRFYGIDNYAPPIIPLDLFQRVQNIMKEHAHDRTPKTAKRPYLFSGLIRCPVCGASMNAQKRTRKNAQNGEYHFYQCPGHYVAKKCTFTGTIPETDLEKYLLVNLRDNVQQIADNCANMRKTTTQQAAAAKEASARKALERIKDLYITGNIDRPTYDKDYEKYSRILSEAQAVQAHAKELPPNLAYLLDIDIEKEYASLSAESKREFWRAIIKSISVSNYEFGRHGTKKYDIDFL